MAAAIEVRDVTKRYVLRSGTPSHGRTKWVGRGKAVDFWAVGGVSFDIAVGSTTAILGHNGSGKSTMLKCIAGTLRPTSGSITVRGRLAAMLELGSGFHPELTGRENIFLNGSLLGYAKADVTKRLDAIIDFAQIEPAFIDNPVRNYSSGMYARLGFAVATTLDPDVLLIDEVLSVGDEAFQKKCLDRIADFQRDGRTILIVTHSPDVARLISDKVIVFDHGELIAEGNPTMGVRAFRSALSQGGEVDLGANAPKVSGKVVVDRVMLAPADGRVASGEPFSVEVDYSADESAGGFDFEIDVHSDAGDFLVTASARESGVEPTLGTSRKLRFSIAGLALLSGKYWLTLRAIDPVDRTVHDLLEAVESVVIEHPSHHQGLVDFSVRATVPAFGASTLNTS